MKSMSAVDLSQPKLPPQNLEAEQSVLGAVLLDNSAMAKAMELLVEENFYRTSHRKIYRAMLELSEVGEVIDQITLTERLKAQGEIEAIGGAAYLAELVQSVASSANIRYHARIRRHFFNRRPARFRGAVGVRHRPRETGSVVHPH